MTRNEWLAIYREMRSATRKAGYGAPACVRWYQHGGTFWTFRHDRAGGFAAYPSIIRDRAPSHRIEVELQHAAEFRQKAKTARGHFGLNKSQLIQTYPRLGQDGIRVLDARCRLPYPRLGARQASPLRRGAMS